MGLRTACLDWSFCDLRASKGDTRPAWLRSTACLDCVPTVLAKYCLRPIALLSTYSPAQPFPLSPSYVQIYAHKSTPTSQVTTKCQRRTRLDLEERASASGASPTTPTPQRANDCRQRQQSTNNRSAVYKRFMNERWYDQRPELAQSSDSVHVCRSLSLNSMTETYQRWYQRTVLWLAWSGRLEFEARVALEDRRALEIVELV